MCHIIRLAYLLILLSLISLLSCSKEKGIAEIFYNNPPKDSISFAYRVSTLYYFDEQQKESSFEFTLDTGSIYAWKSVTIRREGIPTSILYIPEYSNGYITSWIDFATAKPIIELTYQQSIPAFQKLISTIKYYQVNNSYALLFEYDSINLKKLSRCALDAETGVIGGVLEEFTFCSSLDLGSCTTNNPSAGYYYGNFNNSLYHSNELIPFLFLLKKPSQNSLIEVLPDLPLYFSKHYPDLLLNPTEMTYEFGLNSEKEPSYFYYRKLPGNTAIGYNFSMR